MQERERLVMMNDDKSVSAQAGRKRARAARRLPHTRRARARRSRSWSRRKRTKSLATSWRGEKCRTGKGGAAAVLPWMMGSRGQQGKSCSLLSIKVRCAFRLKAQRTLIEQHLEAGPGWSSSRVAQRPQCRLCRFRLLFLLRE